MYLDEIAAAQKRGEAKGIVSVCSAHPWVLRAALQAPDRDVLIESTCNQVNQFGGYSGWTPSGFRQYLHTMAEEAQFPSGHLLLGGDHLGPSVWQNEPDDTAMQKAERLVREYVEAGFVKIHLDCSMRLADDPQHALDVDLSARRTARLARVAETYRTGEVRYVIGTEVPVPGGALDHEEGVQVTRVADVQVTLEATREAFLREGLEEAWERVIAVVVQPGVEFGDDFILDYQPEAAQDLVRFIESEPQLVYEAHSTDYQAPQALRSLVCDHFAILKVGPALTFAFREAVFALAMIENELVRPDQRSNLISVVDEVMVRQPGYWERYYRGTPAQRAYQRKYSLSDRVRYYWSQPEIQHALETLYKNLTASRLPLPLLSQFMPDQYARIREGVLASEPSAIVLDKITTMIDPYFIACE